MKALSLTLGFLAATTCTVGAAPERIDGTLFTETSAFRGVGSARSSSQRQLLLNPDGRYIGLFASSQILSGSRITEIPASGAWSYRKLSETQAALTIDGQTRTLTFASDTSGTIPTSDVFFTTISFDVVKYDAPTPMPNCSNRSFVRAGGMAFTGFIIARASRGRVLVRAVGPGLAQFGIIDALQRPTLTVVRAANSAVVDANEGWTSNSPQGIQQANAAAGAFALPASSRDSALLLSLEPGAYIAQVASSDAGDSGQVLIEVYLLP